MLLRLVIATCLTCVLLVPVGAAAQASADSNLARARRILRTTHLVDGHNDLAWRIREDKSAPRDVEVYDLRRARALVDHSRDAPDSIFARLPKNGGIVMVPFVNGFVSAKVHERDVAGIEHVGIGSDFDGIDDVIPGLENVSKFPYLFAELARRGWTDADLRKVAGENFIRAFIQAERVAARVQKERTPSTATIEQLDGKVHLWRGCVLSDQRRRSMISSSARSERSLHRSGNLQSLRHTLPASKIRHDGASAPGTS